MFEKQPVRVVDLDLHWQQVLPYEAGCCRKYARVDKCTSSIKITKHVAVLMLPNKLHDFGDIGRVIPTRNLQHEVLIIYSSRLQCVIQDIHFPEPLTEVSRIVIAAKGKKRDGNPTIAVGVQPRNIVTRVLTKNN